MRDIDIKFHTKDDELVIKKSSEDKDSISVTELKTIDLSDIRGVSEYDICTLLSSKEFVDALNKTIVKNRMSKTLKDLFNSSDMLNKLSELCEKNVVVSNVQSVTIVLNRSDRSQITIYF